MNQHPRLNAREAMLLAIEEGKRGAGFVSPNPLVGCVILDREGHLLAKGYHARLGDLHAEMAAIQNIKDQKLLEGAQLFVTLEPCAHEGRQPSCAKQLAKLPIAKVVYGLEDPNPMVSGQGAEILKGAGKSTIQLTELKDELEDLAEIFLHNMRQKRPFIALKVASSLDGIVALTDGSSQWITGEKARAEVQSLRGYYDCVLTGSGTFLKDKPRLNSRDPRFAQKPQRLVVLDPDGAILSQIESSPALLVRERKDFVVFTGPGLRAPQGITHLTMNHENGVFELSRVLESLRDLGINSVLVEAGPKTCSEFLRQNCVNRVYLFLAPKILGRGLHWSSEFSVSRLDQALCLKNARHHVLGDDVLITGKL